MNPAHAKLISEVDQMNAALAEAFDGLDQADSEIVRQIRDRLERHASNEENPGRLAFKVASMSISRLIVESQVREVLNAE